MILSLLSILLIVTLQHLDHVHAGSNKARTSSATTFNSKPSTSFVPLSCNDNIQNEKCNDWYDYYPNHARHDANGIRGGGSSSNNDPTTTSIVITYTETITIPCGTCVWIDPIRMQNVTMIFQNGIDVQGKLVILDSTSTSYLNITTSMIIVQGIIQIYSTKQSIRSTPTVSITMMGQNDQQGFIPIDSNQNKCITSSSRSKGGQDAICTIGKKGIIVAGGQVDIQGVPPNTPTWLKLYDVVHLDGDDTEHPSAIVIEDSVFEKWDVGAEILITSHTNQWHNQQQRSIRNIYKYEHKKGYVVMELDLPIQRPTTIRQSSDYAVEVALLSRNIMFHGGYDDLIGHHGGHFMIMSTPNVPQTLIGVDIQNFGQQGTIGRYPIHLHWNGNMTGSIIAKNTIRQSNQRCIVVHGTSNLRVEGNVAYDTKGHCYMIEDGIETDNMFIANLGAQTSAPKKIIPNHGHNGIETDDNPSTFWITNPSNSWIGNVAAGSESSGYWFELMLRGTDADLYPELNPKTANLISFQDNVAHSNSNKGFQTYPTGYMPDGLQEMIGLKSYRNGGQGIFLHVSKNIKLENVLVADNRYIGIDIDRAEGIVVRNTTVIGRSRSYTDLMTTQDDIDEVCSMDRLYGIDLHTWKLMPDNDKVTIEDVTFVGYDNECIKSHPIHMDNDSRTGQFNAYSTFRGVTMQNQTSAITFCDAEYEEIINIYITDLDGSLFPLPDEQVVTPASLVSKSASMMTFLGNKKCTTNVQGCFNYCEETCFRSFRYEIDPVNTEGYKLRICSTDNPKLCTDTYGYQKYQNMKDYNFGENRNYFVHVPVGTYDAVFVNEKDVHVWPSFVLSYPDEPTCPLEFPNDAIQLLNLKPGMDECKQLVRNGNIEASNIDPMYWLFRNGEGIEVVPRSGIGKSNAISSITRDSRVSLIQYLDTRCLSAQQGQIYQFNAMIKLEEANGKPYICDPTNRQCPEIGYRASHDGTFRTLASVNTDGIVDGYQQATAYFEINDDIMSSDQTLIYILSNVDNMRMLVDNVSITLIQNVEVDLCNNMIVMPNDDPKKYWKVVDSGQLDNMMDQSTVIATMNDAKNNPSTMLFHKRRDEMDAISYNHWPSLIVSKCFVPNTKWKISIQLQLLQEGKRISCNMDDDGDCPVIRLTIVDGNKDGYVINETYRSYSSKIWNTNQYNVAEAIVTIPSISSLLSKNRDTNNSITTNIPWDGSIGNILFQIGNFPSNYDLVLGSVQMSPL